VMSIGMGLTFVPLTLLATTNVANEDAGLASGIFNTSQQIGGALGLAVLSTLAASRTSHLSAQGVARPEALTRGFHVAFAVGAAFLAAGLVVLVVGIRKRHVESIDVADNGVVAELAA
jgi:sugar phosphate permease